LIAEFDGATGNLKKEYLYGGATLITIEPTAVNSNGTQYTTSDNLGSPRVITNSGGSVVSRHDYMPFGTELGVGTGGRTTGMGFSNSGDNNRKKFTGYERDTETGLDFAQARYYSNTQGRFTSPDAFAGSATVSNPQTFNRYSYCGNNPVNSVDPSGLSGGALFSMNKMDGSDLGGKNHSSFITELEDAEKDHEQRLQNTRDEIAANNALATGQDDLAREIVSRNPALQALDANGNDITSGFVNGEPQAGGGTAGPGANATPQSAPGGRHNTVIITYSDGTQEVRSGGSRSWRNNNPGNIRRGADLQGEIGAAGGFAVFTNEDAGQSAIVELLGRPQYQRLTVSEALARWAPPNENDTAGYQRWVQNVTGIDGQTRMNTLNDGQLRSISNAIRGIEG
jgi:RHS repeat-associated protein